MVQIGQDWHHSALSWLSRRLARTRAVRLREFVEVDQLGPERRRALSPCLYQIFCASYGELSSEVVLDEIVFKPGGYLGLYCDPSGRQIGFSAVKLETVEVDGRPCVSLQGSAYFLPGHRGGRAAGRLGLTLALDHKLRHPLTPLVFAFETLSPVSYRRATRIFAQIYPHRLLDTPPKFAAIAAAVIRHRGLLAVPGRGDVVRYDDPANHARDLPAQLVREDLDVAFYLSRNPDYRRGHILLVVGPLTLLNIVASSSTALTHMLRALLQRRLPHPLVETNQEHANVSRQRTQ